MWYELVSVTIKLQKYYLNMICMFCVSLCEWMAQTRGFIYYTHTEAHVTLTVFSASAASIYEHMNIISRDCYEHFTFSFEKNYRHIMYKQKLKGFHSSLSKYKFGLTSRNGDRNIT